MAQEVPGWGTVIRCGTTEYMNALVEANPSLKGRLQAYEQQTQEWIKANYPTVMVTLVPQEPRTPPRTPPRRRP